MDGWFNEVVTIEMEACEPDALNLWPGVMVGISSTRGIHCPFVIVSGNRALLMQYLQDQWGLSVPEAWDWVSGPADRSLYTELSQPV